MKQKDLGFVLSRVAYSETSSILKCFTREHGLKSFLLQGAKKKYASVLQVFSPVEFTYYQKRDELAKMTEPAPFLHFQENNFHPVKSSCLFFKAEILSKCVHEGQADLGLFEFITEELCYLDTHPFSGNYLLHWLLELSLHMGIQPQVIERGTFFDLMNGEIHLLANFSKDSVKHENVLLLCDFLNLEREERLHLHIDKEARNHLMKLVLNYFHLHISGFKTPHSIEVYQSLWYE